MKTLITGATGQLGRELQIARPAGVEVLALSHTELDLADRQQVEQCLLELRPELVINAAAYTAVDRAESEREVAFAVNGQGAGSLARAAESVGARLIHVSTDFVFAGDLSRPYSPTDEPRPLGVYGASKLEGERQVLAASSDRGLVIRTAWVYSRFGHNFVKTMLRLLSERPHLGVVADQVGAPTWARGLAEIIWRASERPDLRGIVHWTDAGIASWYDLAVAIQEEAKAIGLIESDCQIRPLATSEYPTAATRPRFSVLETAATQRQLDFDATHWRRQLRAMLQDLKNHGED